ncbi:MAG: (2Fe-2S)-binding protein [Bacteriovoracaceae bacterium]|nr:(2Fe-2S)-binding protein [Bacteriovoracaceae bacterium]
MSHKLTLWPSQEVLDINPEESLLIQLKKAGKTIKSSCGGCASCGDCVIVVKSGESNLTSPTFEELRLLGNVFHITKERLSCQTKLTGDAVIDISAHEKKKSKVTDVVSKSPTVVVRKRETLQEMERKSQEKDEVKREEDWYRHWDKTEPKDASKAKHLGGNKRPKPFRDIEEKKDPTKGDNE